MSALSSIAVVLAAAAIMAVAGGYVTMRVALASQTGWNDAMARRADAMERVQDMRVQYLQSIDTRLSRIEGALKIEP